MCTPSLSTFRFSDSKRTIELIALGGLFTIFTPSPTQSSHLSNLLRPHPAICTYLSTMECIANHQGASPIGN